MSEMDEDKVFKMDPEDIEKSETLIYSKDIVKAETTDEMKTESLDIEKDSVYKCDI